MDMVDFAAGDAQALGELQEDPEAVIISEGLAEHLAVPLGGQVNLHGEGLDHMLQARDHRHRPPHSRHRRHRPQPAGGAKRQYGTRLA